jgi:hypothetical protein
MPVAVNRSSFALVAVVALIGVSTAGERTPPAIDISRASVAKLRRPPGSYALRLTFSVRDAPGTLVRYRVAVVGNGRFLASRLGATRSGRATATIRVRPPRKVPRLRIEITASDPRGNEATAVRVVKLPA